jgi:hypothetical protein
MDTSIAFDIRDSLLCLAFLAGVGVSLYARVRRQARAGALAAAGFALLAVDPIIEIVTFRFLARAFDNFDALNWVYICISTPAVLLGVAALIAAVWIAAHAPAAAVTG